MNNNHAWWMISFTTFENQVKFWQEICSKPYKESNSLSNLLLKPILLSSSVSIPTCTVHLADVQSQLLTINNLIHILLVTRRVHIRLVSIVFAAVLLIPPPRHLTKRLSHSVPCRNWYCLCGHHSARDGLWNRNYTEEERSLEKFETKTGNGMSVYGDVSVRCLRSVPSCRGFVMNL